MLASTPLLRSSREGEVWSLRGQHHQLPMRPAPIANAHGGKGGKRMPSQITKPSRKRSIHVIHTYNTARQPTYDFCGVNRRMRRRDKYSFPSLPPSPLLFSPLQARRKRRRRRRWRRLRRRLAAAVATTRGDGGGGENEAGGVCVGRAKTPSARPLDRGGWSTVTRGGPSNCVVQVRRH